MCLKVKTKNELLQAKNQGLSIPTLLFSVDTIQGSASLWLFHYLLTLGSRFFCVCLLSLSLFLSYFSSRSPFLSFSLLQKLICLVSRTSFRPGHALHLLVLLSFIIRCLMDCSPTPTCSREPVAGWPQ